MLISSSLKYVCFVIAIVCCVVYLTPASLVAKTYNQFGGDCHQ